MQRQQGQDRLGWQSRGVRGAQACGHSLGWLSRATLSTRKATASFMAAGLRGCSWTRHASRSLALGLHIPISSPLPRARPHPPGPPENVLFAQLMG